MDRSWENLVGRAYAGLVLVAIAGDRQGGHVMAVCRCRCGKAHTTRLDHLKTGHTKSCGCTRTHGKYRAPEYVRWLAMRDRCAHRKVYIERGITVCDRWKDDFQAFYTDMGDLPSLQHTLERIDNDQGYTPENCRWATRRDQDRNKRNNQFLTFEGRTQCIADWAHEYGIDRRTLRSRLDRGWVMERALNQPLEEKRHAQQS